MQTIFKDGFEHFVLTKSSLLLFFHLSLRMRISGYYLDRRFPDVMYAANVRDNTGNKLFRTLDGGVSWQNISENFPNQYVNGLEVSPVTGEVFLSSGNGSRVLLPPYPKQNTAWEQVTYKYNYLYF